MIWVNVHHCDIRAGENQNLVVKGPGKKTTVIAPGAAQSFALEAGQALKVSVPTATSAPADDNAINGEESA